MSKILLIDWTNLMFRSYHSSSNMGMHNWTKPTWVVYSSLNSLNKMKEFIDFKEWEDKIIFTFDNKTSKQNRKKIFNWYKWNRDYSKVPSIFWQIEDFKELISYSEHEVFDEVWLEADDICWILSKRLIEEREDIEHIYIYSSDKDFYQFLNPTVTIIKALNWWELIEYDYLKFDEEYELTSEEYVEYKAIVWDWSDNIFNIKSFWNKWAYQILEDNWWIDSWLENKEWWHILPKKIREIIEKWLDNWEKNWFDIKVPWYEIDEDWKAVKIWYWDKLIQWTVKEIMKTNYELVKINYDYEWIDEEDIKRIEDKINNMFKKERNQNKISEILEDLKIKRVKI